MSGPGVGPPIRPGGGSGSTGADEAPAPLDPLDSPAAGGSAVRGSALRSAGYVAGLGLGLASAPLLTRHLGVVAFGQYVTVMALVALVAGVTEGGLNSIALREFAANDASGRRRVMADLLGIRVVLSIAGAAIAVGFALVAGYDHILLLGTAVAVGGTMVQVVQTLLGTALQGSMRFGWVTSLELLRQVVSVVLIVILVVGGASLLPFLAVPLAAAVVTLVITLRVVRKITPRRPTFHVRRWWPLIRDTLPFAAAIAVSVIYFRIGVLLVSLISTEEETGYFATSFRIIDVLIGLPPLIAGAAFPILSRAAARGNHDRLRFASGRLIDGTLILGTWLALSLALGSQVAIDIFGGPQFDPSVPVLRIQGLAVIATCMAIAVGHVLLALRRHTAILIANAVALLASVALCLALIPALGAQGAALAIVLAEFTLVATQITFLIRVQPALRGDLTTRPVGLLLIGGAASTVAFIPGSPALVDVILGTIAFFGLLALMGRFPPEARELFARIAR